MGKRNIFLTSNGLSNNMKNLFIKQVGKNADEIKVLFVPTAGIGNDGAREGAAVCFHELTQMGISNICVYHLDMVPSKNYQRTYSAYVQRPHMLTRLMTVEEIKTFDAVIVSGGECAALCREMVRTGFDKNIRQAVCEGVIYIGVSAGSMFAAGNFAEGLHLLDVSIVPHADKPDLTADLQGTDQVKLADGWTVYINDEGAMLQC